MNFGYIAEIHPVRPGSPVGGDLAIDCQSMDGSDALADALACDAAVRGRTGPPAAATPPTSAASAQQKTPNAPITWGTSGITLVTPAATIPYGMWSTFA